MNDTQAANMPTDNGTIIAGEALWHYLHMSQPNGAMLSQS